MTKNNNNNNKSAQRQQQQQQQQQLQNTSSSWAWGVGREILYVEEEKKSQQHKRAIRLELWEVEAREDKLSKAERARLADLRKQIATTSNELAQIASAKRTLEDSVYVSPAHQGRGVGRALLGSLLDAARELGAKQMLAVIGDSGNAASIGLHRAMGFQDAGVLREVGEKFGRVLDVVILQRAL